MRKKLISLLLAVVMCLTLLPSPVALAADNDFFTLTIEYYIQGEETKIAPTYKASLLPNSKYSVDSPTVAGYKVKDDSQSTVTGTMENQDKTVKVVYVTNEDEASYTITYKGLKVDGSEDMAFTSKFPEKDRVVTGKAPIGEIITAEDKTFSGYVRESEEMTLQVTADGKAALDVYYVQNLNPAIVFSTGGSAVQPFTAAKDTDITASLQEHIKKYTGSNAPTKPGYAFAGWDWNGDGKYNAAEDTPLTIMPAQNTTVKAAWTPATATYTVEYWFQDVEGDGCTRDEGLDETRSGKTESKVTTVTGEDEVLQTVGSVNYNGKYNDKTIADETIIDEKTMTASPFYGFDYKKCDEIESLNGDGTSVLKLYYDREIWSVKIHRNPAYYSYRQSGEGGQYYGSTYKELTEGGDPIEFEFSGRYGAVWDTVNAEGCKGLDLSDMVVLTDYFNGDLPNSTNYAKEDTSPAKYYLLQYGQQPTNHDTKEDFVNLMWLRGATGYNYETGKSAGLTSDPDAQLSSASTFAYRVFDREDSYGAKVANLYPLYAREARYSIRWYMGETLDSAKAGNLSGLYQEGVMPDPNKVLVLGWNDKDKTEWSETFFPSEFENGLYYVPAVTGWEKSSEISENTGNIQYLDVAYVTRLDKDAKSKTFDWPKTLPEGYYTKLEYPVNAVNVKVFLIQFDFTPSKIGATQWLQDALGENKFSVEELGEPYSKNINPHSDYDTDPYNFFTALYKLREEKLVTDGNAQQVLDDLYKQVDTRFWKQNTVSYDNGAYTAKGLSTTWDSGSWWLRNNGPLSVEVPKKPSLTNYVDIDSSRPEDFIGTAYPQVYFDYEEEYPNFSGSLKNVEDIWKTAVFSRTGTHRTGCPVCAGKSSAKRQQRYQEMLAETRRKANPAQ